MISKIVYNIKKPQFSQKIQIAGYLLLPMYINRPITKKIPIETLLEMIDSSIKNLGELESIISKSVSIGNFFVMDRFMYSGNKR